LGKLTEQVFDTLALAKQYVKEFGQEHGFGVSIKNSTKFAVYLTWDKGTIRLSQFFL